MKIALIGKKYIVKQTLPKNINDTYWIIDKKRDVKLIKIDNNQGKLEIQSNKDFQIINPKYLEISDNNVSVVREPNCIIEKTELKENNIYAICFGDITDVFILFCMPDYEGEFFHMDIANVNEFTIGFSKQNDLMYENALVADTHAKIYKENDKWVIENHDNNYGLFVNEFPVFDNKKNLFNGDVVFIMGLKLIIIKDTIYITNPDKNVRINKNIFVPSKIKNEIPDGWNFYEEDIDKGESKQKYYLKSPRLENSVKKETIKIDEPPQVQEDQKRSVMLAIASSLLLGVMSFSYIGSMIRTVGDGSASVGEIIISFIEAIAMIAVMIVIPILEIKLDKKNNKEYEEKRQQKYTAYLNNKREQIEQIRREQRDIRYKKDVSANDCVQIILSKNHRLWERTIEDDDFLSVRIGIGQVPFELEIARPEEKFAMVEDTLEDEYKKICENTNIIEDAPVVTSFSKNNISAFISKDYEIIRKFMRTIILQLVTFQSYDELKLVFMLNETKSSEWDYVKLLPHVWDDSKQVRFFADNDSDMNEISNYLQEELKNRVQSKAKDYKDSLPYYLIITDDYKQIESLPFITSLMEQPNNLGFSLLCISDDLYKVPNRCSAFFNISDLDTGTLIYTETSTKNEYKVNMEQLKPIHFEKISQQLANIPLRVNTKGASSLPSSLNFLEMYNTGTIEQLEILKRWRKNDSTLSLKAPIGADSFGNIISLDIHEKYHGPHGLIAGATGSGKSEFIITYILSLAINYHPDDVTFLLIDYKGGGLAGAFKKNNIQLPHLVGTITNIDTNGLQRSLTSIQSELRRRQVIFNEARNMTDGGTIDIYKYQRLYHDGMVKEPIPHLFIICDEFAELKQQQEDFMEELISVSRIGRSLGVHLILATQKPAGIVNDQIRSNSKFAVCLKVQDTSDSQDVIEKHDAAYLKKAGQFYLRVGQDEVYVLGQAGWAGAPYVPSDTIKKRIDTSVEFINNIGSTIKRVDDLKQQKQEAEGEQLTAIVEYLCKIAKEQGLKTKNLWLENISEDIYVKDIREKYRNEKNEHTLEAVVGEFDDPANQRQGIVKIDLLKKDNLIVFGNAKSGKETFLSTFIYDLITEYSSEKIQFYIMDFGSEALKIYKSAPHVGDMIFMGEDEKLFRFFEMISNEIKKRKEILSDYNGDYNLYIQEGNKMPFTIIMINNYDAFNENYEDKYDDLFLTLSRDSLKCGMMFVLSANSTACMKYRLAQNFNKKIALQLNDDDEYFNIFDNVERKRPPHMFGRGLVKIDGDAIYEFQTAKICEHIEYNEHLTETIARLQKENKVKAKALPALPKVLELEDVKEFITDMSNVPIGMLKDDLSILVYDFMEKFLTIITSRSEDISTKFAYNICEEAKLMENTDILILDSYKSKADMKKEYKNFVSDVKKGIKAKDDRVTVCVIAGIVNLIDDEIIDDFDFNELLEKAKESGKFCFIIIDRPNKLEEHGFDTWYENNINGENGIWIGKGIENQTLITTNFSAEGLINDCDNSFGYCVENGDTTFIKLLGMKEEGDDNE